MLTTGGQRPRGLNELSGQVFEVLESFSVSPWSLLHTACSAEGVDPFSLEAAHLPPVIDRLRSQIARMTDDAHAEDLAGRLRALA